MRNYYDNRFVGAQVEELIKLLLKKSGYHVYNYGYEHSLPSICEKVREKGIKSTDTALRIRYSPDFLVHDREKNELMLVEVKTRKTYPAMKVYIQPFELKNYQKYWSDTLLVIVTNKGNVFYIQEVAKLEPSARYYNLAEEFQEFKEVFVGVKEDLPEYKNKAIQILKERNHTITDKDANLSKPKSSGAETKNSRGFYCSECKKGISSNEFNYSIKYFDKPLCFGCQPIREKKRSVPPTKPELNTTAKIEIGGKLYKKKITQQYY
jgi:hypothetical protein